MTRKKRLLAAIRRQKTDMVSVSPLIFKRFAFKMTGKDDHDAILEAHRAIGSTIFGLRLDIPFEVNWPSGFGDETEVITGQGRRVRHKRRIITPAGTLTAETVTGYIPSDPTVDKKVEYPVKRIDDYKIVRQHMEEWLTNAKPKFDEVIRIHRRVGDDGVANIYQQSTFSYLSEMRGLESFLMDFYDEPGLMRDMLELAGEVTKKKIKAFNECVTEVLLYDVSWSSGSLVGPAFFARWVLDDVVDAVKNVAESKYIGFYMVGKLKCLLPLMVEARPHFISSFDNVGGDCSLKESKRQYGDKMCLMGNFNPVLLACGTPEEVKEEALRCLEEGAEGGGFVVVTSDEVPADAKIENMRIMVETVDQYGKL